VILLDTHIWVWWIQQDPRLSREAMEYLDSLDSQEIGVSAISCWEVATLHSLGRIVFQPTLEEWMDSALVRTGITLIPLSPSIAIESAQLPGEFHRDPADRILVATARILACLMVTADEKILVYPHPSRKSRADS
jgi:PIN domain nuclease of toxin-antitoxin system